MLVAVGQDAFCVGLIECKKNCVACAVVVSEFVPDGGLVSLALLAQALGMTANDRPAATKDAVPMRLMLVRKYLMCCRSSLSVSVS
jgi:hypothetical protein